MQTMLKYFLLVFIPFVSLPLAAQTIKLKTEGSPKYPPFSALPYEQRQQVLATVEAHLNEYALAAPMFDDRQKKVTSEKVTEFQALFNPNAMMVKDYEENIQGELVTLRDYTSGVFNRLDRQGVQVKLGNATLLEIIDDQLGFWVVVVKVDKLIYNYVTEKQEVKINAGGRFLEQEFRFDVPKNDLNRARIARIARICRGKECDVAGDYARYMGLSIGSYLPFVSTSYSDFWQTTANPDNLDVKGEVSFFAGFDFLTNKLSPKASVGKNLFVTAGLHFDYKRFSSTLTGYNIPAFDTLSDVSNQVANGEKLDFLRDPSNTTVEEKLNVAFLKIPLGVGIRMMKKRKAEFLLNFKLVPAFFITNSSGSLTGYGRYDALLPEADWRFLEEGAANTADQAYIPLRVGDSLSINETPSPDFKGFSISAELSPTLYIHLSENNPNWSLLIGLDLNYNLGSFVQFDETNAYLLRYNDEYDKSLAQHYLKGMSNFSAGFRIGLHHHLTTKP
ncbi:MAG: hypothetical protein H6577_13835 [Lewinellaceae bacterium]|nr:hypothetical protein [Saprospiraceae bacterium]MCB9339207.1 hypothetical protein [Lewinellaceae bacterium]